MLNERQLLGLKKEIEDAHDKTNQLAGEKKALLATLKKEFGCDSIEDAQVMYENLIAEATKLNEKIEALTNKLEKELEKYDRSRFAE